uniref:Uncharacterized protein n=1 Tax=Ascaris lumbricoides TaxID=6252 RepID=A0A0M3I2H5_ASCLU
MPRKCQGEYRLYSNVLFTCGEATLSAVVSFDERVLCDLQRANATKMPRKCQEEYRLYSNVLFTCGEATLSAVVSFDALRVWINESKNKNVDTANNEKCNGQPAYWTHWNGASQQWPQDTKIVTMARRYGDDCINMAQDKLLRIL